MKFAVWSSEALSGRAQPAAEWPRGGDTEVSHGVVTPFEIFVQQPLNFDV